MVKIHWVNEDKMQQIWEILAQLIKRIIIILNMKKIVLRNSIRNMGVWQAIQLEAWKNECV